MTTHNHYSELDKNYISVLEIGGSHAHRLRPLIEALGLLTLVITDLDSISQEGRRKVLPERGQGYRTSNDTLKSWIPGDESLDSLLDKSPSEKQSNDKSIRVAYQCLIDVNTEGSDGARQVIPYTFEDALVWTNVSTFKNLNEATGLLRKMSEALGESTADESSNKMFESLNNGNKAEMALAILFTIDPKELTPPTYIAEGLEWLQEKLRTRGQDFIEQAPNKGEA